MKSEGVTIQIKPLCQIFFMILFIALGFCTKEFESAIEFFSLVMGRSEIVQLNYLSVLN